MSGAIQKSAATASQTIQAWLTEPKRQQALTEMLGKTFTPERITRVAVNAIAGSESLQKCSPESLLKAIYRSAELGLEPGGALGHAYLVPYKGQATLQIGFKGFIELMLRAGHVSGVRCVIVHQNDEFTYSEGLRTTVDHKPNWKNPGPWVAVYCVIERKDGSFGFGIMSRDKVMAVKARSAAVKSGMATPWDTDEEEMAKKTVLKRTVKYERMDSEKFAEAIDADNEDFVDGEILSSASTPALPSSTESVKARIKGRVQIQDVSTPSPTPPPVLAPEPPPLTDADMPGGEAA